VVRSRPDTAARARSAAGQHGRSAAGQPDLTRALECFWHPVCQATEVGSPGGAPAAVTLLGRDLVVARLSDGALVALDDRCAHRSTRLSIGTVDGTTLRCAHHGWRWGADGHCVEIPSLRDAPIPARARVGSYAIAERYGLVWVRIDPDSTIPVPPCPAADEGATTVEGAPYVWPVAAARRVEDVIDPSHAWGAQSAPEATADHGEPPLPEVERLDGELRFAVEVGGADGPSLAVTTRVVMPTTVQLEAAHGDGGRHVLWLAASPVDEERCRCFWRAAAAGWADDQEAALHVAEAHTRVLSVDEPIMSNQVPPWFPLDAHDEVSVRTDLVSNVYRRWLRELVAEVKRGGAGAAARSLGHAVPRRHDAAS
jgi:phenylpropionate dioxygenase-like ring-hydroxylating dioxygenase large terminal subunit